MLNNSEVTFYDNFGLIFKRSKDEATNSVENRSLSTTPLLIDASSRQNRSEYLHKPYIARNYNLWRSFLSLIVWEYRHSSLLSEIEADFSVKCYLKLFTPFSGSNMLGSLESR